MAEYNFWDDRTIECNDSCWCPVINDYCLDQRCTDCKARKEMDDYYGQEGGEHHEEND